jgi:hypothetical protein
MISLEFGGFFVWIFKTREENGFFKIRRYKGLCIAWGKRLETFVKLMSKNSIEAKQPRNISEQAYTVRVRGGWGTVDKDIVRILWRWKITQTLHAS